MEFYSGTVAKGPPPSTAVTSRSPKMSPSAAGAPSDITEAAFSRWKVELQNKLIVEQEKQAHRDRLQYKKHEDYKYWERKQALCKKTVDQFGKAKLEMEAIRQANLTRGAEYKAELEEMKEMAAAQREEWMQFGHELTVQHGPEQTERTRARLAETAELKAEQGRQVKQLSQANKKQRHVQRTARLEEKRQIVESTKQQLFGSAEEAKNFAFHQREEIGGEVRRTERRWRSLSKQEREAFLTHAHDNHEKNDNTKEHMREVRKDLIKKNAEKVNEEKERKMTDAMKVAESREERVKTARGVRDAIYSSRYADSEKTKLMSQSPQEAAALTGIMVSPSPMSPQYRLQA